MVLLPPDITRLVDYGVRSLDLLGTGGARGFRRHRPRDPRRAVGSGSGRGRRASPPSRSARTRDSLCHRILISTSSSGLVVCRSRGNPMPCTPGPLRPARFSHRGFRRPWLVLHCCVSRRQIAREEGRSEDLSDVVSRIYWSGKEEGGLRVVKPFNLVFVFLTFFSSKLTFGRMPRHWMKQPFLYHFDSNYAHDMFIITL